MRALSSLRLSYNQFSFLIFRRFLFIFLALIVSTNIVYNQDPGLTWVKQLGGSGLNIGRSVTVDSWGNIYTAGYFDGIMDLNPGPQCFYLTSNGGKDIFISKLDASGNFCWAVSIGSYGDDIAYSIDWNTNGSLSITGSFEGTVDFNPGSGCYFLSSDGCSDVFILNLSIYGNLCWAKKAGGCSNDTGRSIKSDPWGNIYLCGSFCATADFNPGPGICNLSAGGYQDGFILKLDPAGNFCWARKLGSYWDDSANGIIVDNSGNVSVTGNYAGNICIETIYGQVYLPDFGGYEIFIAKLNSSGNFLWAKGIGGNYDDIGQSIQADNQENLLITGSFIEAVDFDPGAGCSILTSSCFTDIFILKLSPNGDFNWAKRFGGTGNDSGYGIAADGSGNVYATGFFENSCNFNPGPGTCMLSSCGSQDIFILKLDCTGHFHWAKQFGSFNQDIGFSIDLDAGNNIVTTGFFKNTVDFDPGPGTFQLTSAGNSDAFVQKLGSCSPCVPVSIICHPQSQIASIGSQAVFNVSVSGTPPFLFQWKKNGCIIPGANNSTYITPVLNFCDNGSTYSCVITNCNGSYCVYSNIALLTVMNNCYTPTVQATCISFSNVMSTQMTVNWLNGNGTRRIVVAKASCNIFGYPADNINYYPNSAFGYGNTIAPGEYVVYNGSGSSCTVTNLVPNINYYFRVFEYSCSNPQYLTCCSYGNPACRKTGITCPPPGIQAYYIHFSEISVQEMTVHWKNGTGTNRIVVAKAWSDISGNPVNGTVYMANNKFGYGSMLGPGEFVVYNGTGNFVCVKNLESSTRYYFRVFEYCCDPPQYLCFGAFGNSNYQETGSYCFGPTVQASEINFSEIWPTQMTVDWAKGNGEKRIVIAKCGSNITGTPINGISYQANSCFGSGSKIENGEFVIYNGTGSSTTVTGLEPGRVYHFKVFEYNCFKEQYLVTNSNGNPSYQITPNSCSPPTLQASDITFSGFTDDQITVNWKNGNGTKRLVVCKLYEPITRTPVNGVEYQGNTIFKCGDYIGPGEYVVYNGTGNSVTVTNLIKGKTYFFRVFEYTCFPPAYLTSAAYGNPNGNTLGITIPTVKFVLANNILKNQPALPETYKFYDDQTPYSSNDPVKICADGSTSTYFRLNVSDSEGIGLQITDNTEKIVTNEKMSVDFAKYGSIGKPVIIDKNNIEIPYTHPVYMDLSDKLYRDLKLRITFNGVPVAGINIPLHIFRAPALLVHGIWSDGLNDIYNELINSKIHTADLLLLNDYAESSSESFSENSVVVPEGIMSLLIKARNKKYSAGKIDVIGHGMGGTLSRYYLQDLGDLKYRNDINKLISVNSPHNGTQAANMILSSNASATQNLLNILGYETGAGALTDLRANSIANSSLNSTVISHHSVPLFTINCVHSYSILNSQSSDWDRLIFYYTYWNNPNLFNNLGITDPESLAKYIYFDERGDLFVPSSSQKGGIPLTNELPYISTHTGSVNDNGIVSLLKSKLQENPDDPAKFWKNGFGTSVQLPVRTFIMEPDDNNLFPAVSDTVNILAPDNNSTYFSGDSIMVICKATDGINSIFMVAGANQQILKFQQTNDDSLSTFLHIPADFTGRVVIYCAGRNNNSFLDDQTIYVNILPIATLDSIELKPENLIVGTGSTKSFNVYGYYNDGIKRKITGLSGISNTISDKTIADITGTFKILGKQTGNTRLKSEFQGKKDSIDILVYYSQIIGKSNFEVNNNSVCEKGVLQFSSTSTGTPDSLKWFFEGGNPSVSGLAEQYVVYENPGIYDVSLIAFYANRKDTLIINGFINVNEAPEPVIIAEGTSSFCEGETLTLTSSPGTLYDWSNGLKTQSIDVNMSGAYFVSVTNEYGCSDVSDTILVTFSPPVTPSVVISSSSQRICAGDNISFTATTQNAGNVPKFQWFVNGILQDIDSATFSTNDLAAYSIVNCILKSDAPCVTQNSAISNFIAVSVDPVITPSVLIDADKTSACEGENIIINAIGQNEGTAPVYNWFIDGELQAEKTSQFSSSRLEEGSNIYCEMISNARCLSDTIAVSDTLSFKIDPIKSPAVSITSSGSEICSKDTIVFTALPENGGNNPVYQWFVNGISQQTNSSTFESSEIEDGAQVFCLLTSDASCLTETTAISNFISVSVKPTLTPSVSISASATSVYSCDLVIFTATAVNGGESPQIRWFVNGDFAGLGAVLSNSAFLNGSQVYCTLKTDLPCATSQNAISNIISIAVNPLPQPIVTIAHDTIFATNYRDDKYTYTWYYKGDSVASTPFLLCSQFGSGSYYLVVQSGNCSVTSNSAEINCTVGTWDTESFSSVILYPNPVNKMLTIEGDLESQTDLTITLYNILGIEITKQEVNTIYNRFSTKFNMEDLPLGMYFVAVNTDFYRRIIIVEKVD